MGEGECVTMEEEGIPERPSCLSVCLSRRRRQDQKKRPPKTREGALALWLCCLLWEILPAGLCRRRYRELAQLAGKVAVHFPMPWSCAWQFLGNSWIGHLGPTTCTVDLHLFRHPPPSLLLPHLLTTHTNTHTRKQLCFF